MFRLKISSISRLSLHEAQAFLLAAWALETVSKLAPHSVRALNPETSQGRQEEPGLALDTSKEFEAFCPPWEEICE